MHLLTKNNRWLSAVIVLAAAFSAFAQTTEFTYQGKLNDGGVPASASYDMRFKLFDAPAAGNQVLTTQTKTNVPTVGGIFTVALDFTAIAFKGTDRWLEISISPAGQNNFVPLAPRQKFNSAPYAVQSLNAATAENSVRLGNLEADQYTQTNDARLFDARTPLAGSNDYVQNSQTSQPNANFTVGGTGKANILEAATQFNLGGNRILSNAGINNLFVGTGTGAANTNGFANSFFGDAVGTSNTSGRGNSFFGSRVGEANTTGGTNSFFGELVGFVNTSGEGNSFFGHISGRRNTTGSNNIFIGLVAGELNTTGSNNIFIGRNSGTSNVNTQVSNSIVLGDNAKVSANNSIAIGNSVTVSTANTILLGTDAQTTRIPGTLFMRTAETFGNNTGSTFSGLLATNLVFRNFGRDILPSPANVCVRAISAGTGTGWGLTQCSSALSSAENKIDVQPFAGGLEIINRLNPVAFKWRADGTEDIGLNAEDVAEIAPELVTRDENGKIEDVKKQSLNALFINAFKEQQKQIEMQAKQIDALKKLLCQSNLQAAVCREKQQ